MVPPSQGMQSQDDALYNYAHSVIRATPKRDHARLSKNAEPDTDDSLALLLIWGAEEKRESVSSVVAAAESVGDADSCETESVRDERASKTWKIFRSGWMLVVLVLCFLVMILLLCYGVISMPAKMSWS